MLTESCEKQIRLTFQGLNRKQALQTFPSIGTLRNILSNALDLSADNIFYLNSSDASKFATAAIEMWHRAIHSFLISASLINASRIWSSVAGYYSSHYSIRAFAHLFGYFQLYLKHKKNIKLEINGSNYECNIEPKGAKGEHKFYWQTVHKYFLDDSFFPENNEYSPFSDSAHRNKINYFDHINSFHQFQSLNDIDIKNRVIRIINLEYEEAPILDSNSRNFPEIENVQMVAFYRLVKFREILDKVLENKNKFWNYHREPSWCRKYLKYKIIKTESIIETTRINDIGEYF